MTRPIPSLKDMIRRLVGISSISSYNPEVDQGNREVVEQVAAWAEALGFSTEIMSLPHHPDKLNLIAKLGEGEGGLVLSGHADTVPFARSNWSRDPLGCEEAEDKIFGRGTCDMKAFLAVALEASVGLDARDLKEPLYVIVTADEETSMAGARILMESGKVQARYAIVGEPTELRPVYQHKGILMESIEVVGRAGHSSNPALGANALEGMHSIIGGLLAWRREIQKKFQSDAFEVPYPTMNLGIIEGGAAANQICDACRLVIDLRFLPGMSIEGIQEELDRVVRESLNVPGVSARRVSLFQGVPAFETPRASPIVEAAREWTGHEPETVAFGTEAPFYRAMGIDTIVLGPGSIAQAHQPDEFIEVAQLDPAVALMKRFVARFCGA